MAYSYRFDAACQSPSNEYAVIYERLGTKGLVLQRGEILREINRSFYHADKYEYPIAFASLPDGREVLIHCPDEYNRLEIEDVATGFKLTQSELRKPSDLFHSRLAVNDSGSLLMSAGWVWHPFDIVAMFRLTDCLTDPATLDQSNDFPGLQTEISSAAFLDDNRLVIATSKESFLDEEDLVNPDAPRTSSLMTWDIAEQRILSQVKVSEEVGTLLPIDDHTAVGFYEHPKLFDLQTGEVVARCASVHTGKQLSSIVWGARNLPPLAIDAKHKRFAVASEDEVCVFAIG